MPLSFLSPGFSRRLFLVLSSVLAGLASSWLWALDQSPSLQWKKPEMEGLFSLQTEGADRQSFLTGSGQLIWRRGRLQLYRHSSFRLLDADAQSYWMIVNYQPGSKSADILAHKPEVVAIYPGQDEEQGFALVKGRAPKELDTFILSLPPQTLHNCGRFEGLNLRTVLDLPTHLPPIYKERIRLDAVASLMAKTSQTRIRGWVQTLAANDNRGHNSTEGEAVPAQIVSFMTEAAGAQASAYDISKVALSSGRSSQDNVVLSIPGLSDDQTTVIVGAHMDTIIGSFSPEGSNPGADDNASGIATMLEVLKVFSDQAVRFDRRVEFHAYGAEEVGLWGSLDLAGNYRSEGRKVAAMIQLDMDSFSHEPDRETIYLIENDTSSVLRRSAKDILNSYLGGDYQTLTLQAGTSDHKSWTNNGFPAVFPFEHPLHYNKSLHTSNDTETNAGRYDLTERFARLVIGFVSHHAGLKAAQSEYASSLASDTISVDMKIAVLATDSQSSWDIAVATPTSVESVSLCLGSQVSSFRCEQDLGVLELERTVGGRRFFINSKSLPYTLSSPHVVGVYGHNSSDVVLAERIVTLTRN